MVWNVQVVVNDVLFMEQCVEYVVVVVVQYVQCDGWYVLVGQVGCYVDVFVVCVVVGVVGVMYVVGLQVGQVYGLVDCWVQGYGDGVGSYVCVLLRVCICLVVLYFSVVLVSVCSLVIVLLCRCVFIVGMLFGVIDSLFMFRLVSSMVLKGLLVRLLQMLIQCLCSCVFLIVVWIVCSIVGCRLLVLVVSFGFWWLIVSIYWVRLLVLIEKKLVWCVSILFCVVVVGILIMMLIGIFGVFSLVCKCLQRVCSVISLEIEVIIGNMMDSCVLFFVV